MGYRSDLYALVHGSELLAFKAALKSADLENCFDHWEGDDQLDHLGYAHFTSNTRLKWYDSYEDVSVINAFFQASDLSCLCRIGEDPEDIEYISHNPDLEYKFNISISVDF